MNRNKTLYRILLLFLCAAISLSVLPVTQARADESRSIARFKDVMPGQWYYEAIEYVVTNGYFNGVSNNSFAPNDQMTRAMFVTVLGRYAGVTADSPDEASDSVFVDVEPGAYFSEYVRWAVENEITTGITDSIFGYAESVTREQAAVFLYRYAQLVGLDTSIDQIATPNTFTVGSNPSPWAMKAMTWAMNKGIMRGIGNDLNPQAVVTRAQVAQIMLNFSQFVNR